MSDPSGTTLDAWRAEVLAELGGAPLETLRSHLLEGLDVQPLYTAGPAPVSAARGATPAGPATGRTLVVTAPGRDSPLDERIREELTGGADGIAVGPNDVGAALAVIEALGPHDPQRLVVVGEAGGRADASCVVLDDPLGTVLEGRSAAERARRYDAIAASAGRSLAVRGDLVHEAGGHAVLELGLVLAIFAEHLRALAERGLSPSDASRRATVALALGPDVLVEVAKVRALRACLERLLAHAAPGAAAPLPWIHACTGRRSLSRLDVPTNALRVTLSSIAALLGGVELWTPAPYDALEGGSPRGRRFARLVPVVLREEGHLGRVLDPLGGAYAVEALTDAMAASAWEVLRALEREGGFAAAWESGTVRARVEQAAKERAARVRSRKQPLVGVSQYANAADVLEARAPLADTSRRAPGASPQGLELIRDAEPFERVRARTAAAAPVFLATLGPKGEHAPRLDFARGLFSVGGFRTSQGAPGEFAASGARVACLCGSDERYAAEAEGAVAELVKAGAARVVLAGKPGAREPALRAAGVSDFVSLGCDVPLALEGALDALGGAS